MLKIHCKVSVCLCECMCVCLGVCVLVCMWEREKDCVYLCVCVCVWSSWQKGKGFYLANYNWFSNFLSHLQSIIEVIQSPPLFPIWPLRSHCNLIELLVVVVVVVVVSSNKGRVILNQVVHHSFTFRRKETKKIHFHQKSRFVREKNYIQFWRQSYNLKRLN